MEEQRVGAQRDVEGADRRQTRAPLNV
jgi:hypothetical protein